MAEYKVTSCGDCPFVNIASNGEYYCHNPTYAASSYLGKIDIIDPQCPLREEVVTVRLDVMSLAKEVPETRESERNVHTEHCCLVHGCKYGNDECPVATKKQRQTHLCEMCSWDSEW